MKVKSVSALLVAIVAIGIAASQASGAATWTVDKTTGTNNCAGNICKTIQKAVDKAAAGDTIIVNAGTYNESVTVTKKLTIKANKKAPDTLSCDDHRTDPDPTKYSIVEPPAGLTGFDLSAAVTLDGFIFQNADNNAAVTTRPTSSGYVLKNNLFQDNTIGLYLNSNGTTTVTANCFRDNNNPGSSSGDGIYSDLGLKSATIGQNRFWNNASDDIVLTGTVNPSIQTVSVTGNISSSSAGFITVLLSKGVTISGNIVKNTTDGSTDYSAAVLFWGANTTFAIKNNIIQDGAGSGIVFDQINGQACGGGCGAAYDGPNTGGTVSNNIVNRMGLDGLYVIDESSFGATTNSLEKTTVNNNIFGSNGDDGIHVAKQTLPNLTAAKANTFTGNIASTNPKHDCHDSNNKDVWTGLTNIGKRVNKGGLCFPGDVVVGPQNHTAV